MHNRLLNTYQPFEVAWFKQAGVFYVLVNKGCVHSFFKPERQVNVDSLVDIMKEESEFYELTDGKILYLQVLLNRENYNQGFTVGVPVSATVEIADEIPDLEEPPFTMYFEICRANGSIIEQGICSDVWAGWKRFEDTSSSSDSSSSDSSVYSSSSSSSDSSSSPGDDSSYPPDDSSSSEMSSV